MDQPADVLGAEGDVVGVAHFGVSGDRPAYVRGPVEVIGEDIYGVNSDGNRIGCE